MNFAVIGGGKLSALLCFLLWWDGHRVRCYGLERAELPREIYKAGCLESCIYRADCVILPEVEKGMVTAGDFGRGSLLLEEVLSCLWPGQKCIRISKQ